MKKIFFPMLAVASIAPAFTSCEDQLDVEQKGVINMVNFYKTDADCEKALATTYESFMIECFGRTTTPSYIFTPSKVLANDPGDDVLYAGGNYGDHEFGGAVNEFRYRHTTDAADMLYKGLYASVYNCNTVLNYFENRSDATPFMKQACAEARVLRACDYFYLACYWGQPPFVDQLLPADALPSNSEMTQQEYFLWVASECEAALPNLTTRNGKTDKKGAVRVTTGFANALAGKAYLFAKQYDKAKAALKKVVDSGNYDLVPGDQFANLFHVEGDANEEKVFECNLEYNSSLGDWSFGSGGGYMNHSTWMEANCFCWREGNMQASPLSTYNGNLGGWGSIGIPEWYGEAFQANDGDSYRRKATIINIEDAMYLTEMGREAGMTYQQEGLADMSVEELKASKKIGINNLEQGLYGNSFWFGLKHIARGSDMTDGGGSHGSNLRLNNLIVMRYAEVLLNYAEACIQTNDKGTALTVLNKIQERAGSKHKSTEATMDELKNEKLFEMWFEGCRFQDILRWDDKDGKARLAQAGSATPHVFDKLFRDPDAIDPETNKPMYEGSDNVLWQHGTKDNSRFYIVHTHEAKDAGFKVGFVEGIHNLFPYPSDALAQNPNLKGNPSNDY